MSLAYATVFLKKKIVCTRRFINLSVFGRVRLRKKTWKNPGTVFLDYHVYEEDISISSNWEVFLEVLDGKKKKIK